MTQIKKHSDVTDDVLKRVSDLEKLGELRLPDNYSAENALKAAFITLQSVEDKNNRKALEVCTKDSITMALFEMVTKGLSAAKKQCYFVIYGNTLQFVPSYFGNLLVAKREAGVDKVSGQVIYKGDVFEYGIDLDTGNKVIKKHEPKLENINPDNIVGAYAIVTFKDGTKKAEVMTMTQIKKAWLQGHAKGNSPAHRNFPDQMAIRTVINRAIKIENASADDSHLSSNDDGTFETAVVVEEKEKIKEIEVQEPKVIESNKPEVVETKAPEAVETEKPEPKNDKAVESEPLF